MCGRQILDHILLVKHLQNGVREQLSLQVAHLEVIRDQSDFKQRINIRLHARIGEEAFQLVVDVLLHQMQDGGQRVSRQAHHYLLRVLLLLLLFLLLALALFIVIIGRLIQLLLKDLSKVLRMLGKVLSAAEEF